MNNANYVARWQVPRTAWRLVERIIADHKRHIRCEGSQQWWLVWGKPLSKHDFLTLEISMEVAGWESVQRQRCLRVWAQRGKMRVLSVLDDELCFEEFTDRSHFDAALRMVLDGEPTVKPIEQTACIITRADRPLRKGFVGDGDAEDVTEK